MFTQRLTVKQIILSIMLTLLWLPAGADQEKISIQLKWKHGFQFAGYYAAIEKGFFKQAGLAVSLKEIDFKKDFVEQVLAGESEYGVSDSTLLVYHLKNRPVVLINQFFQHSPLVFLSRRDSGILSPYDMAGKTVAYNVTNQGDASLNALLLNTLGGLEKIQKTHFSDFAYQRFLDGGIDVISAYSTSQPFLFKQKGVEVNIIDPKNYGIDFYGDNFFTSQAELEKHPDRVKKMHAATIKGWQYALDHPEEIIQIIKNKYAPHLSLEYLRYEAGTSRQMIVPELVALGTVDPGRYRQAAKDYLRMGFVESAQITHGFFYHLDSEQFAPVELSRQEKRWLKNNPLIHVGGGPDWAPFDFIDERGRYDGVANDYLRLISQKTGLQYKVTIDQWSNNLRKIRENKIDLLGAAYFTDERSKFVNFSKPYFEVLDYFFIRDDLSVESLEDLNGKRVAIPKDYAHGDFLKKHFPKINIVTVNTFGEAIDAVLENRADILYDTYAALTHVLRKEGVQTIIPFRSTRQHGNNPIHIITRKNAPELASIVQKGLAAISEQEKRDIYYKWMGARQEQAESSIALTEAEKQWIKQNRVIFYGAEKDWAPYDFVDEHNQHIGLSKDYLDLIAEKTGLQFKAVVDNWQTLLSKAQNQQLDLLPAIYISEQRQKSLVFTEPYQYLVDFFYVRDDIKITEMADLAGKRLAIPKGYVHLETVRAQYPSLQIQTVDTLLDAIELVNTQQADVLLETQSVIEYWLRVKKIKSIAPFKAIAEETGARKLYMAVSQDKALLAGIINKVLDVISDEERYEMHSKWFGEDFQQPGLRIFLSEAEKKWLMEHPLIRYTGDPAWLPYEAFDQKGEYIGIVAEYLAIIEKMLGIKMEKIPSRSWAEALEMVKSDKVDVISETYDSSLSSQLRFSQPYLSSPVVIVMKNNEDYVENIEQISDRRIAMIKDYGYVHKIEGGYPQISFQWVNNIHEGLTAVSTGKVDALLATLAQASYHISEQGINNIRIVGKTEYMTQLAFGMRSEFEILAPLINRALNNITQPQKQRIFEQWGKQKFIAQPDYRLTLTIAGIFLLILGIIVYWNRKLAIEVKLRKEAEAQTKTLIDNIPLNVFVTNYQGGILTANPKAMADYQLTEEQLSSQNIMDFYKDAAERSDVMEQLQLHGRVEQRIVLVKGGSRKIRSMMVSIIPVAYHDQEALLTIAVDMTERLDMEDALQRAKDSAEAASRAKSAFLANMSHEIRTPMNAIIGFTELLGEQVREPRLLNFVKTIQSAGQSLLILINDILDLSKIEAGKLSIEKTPCNPHELLTEIGDIFTIKVREKNIDLILDIADDIPECLQLDAVRLRQVLFNLIGNAVKFTEQGYIRMRAVCNLYPLSKQCELSIDVEDSGIGISEDQQQIIFQEFAQSSGQDLKKYGGTGLGLAISKRLIEMMGGELHLRSELGKGSCFSVRLTGIDLGQNDAELALEDMDGQQAVEFLPSRILIVDDIEDNRALIAANLEETQIDSKQVENGLQAVRQVQQQHYDLVLMDIRMPVMDGYQAAEQIKRVSPIPIVALTASVMHDEFERHKKHNFDGFLRKPILKAQLFDELARYLPHQSADAETENSNPLILTAQERRYLHSLIVELEKQREHCAEIKSNNNIAEISTFVGNLVQLSENYPVSEFQCYVDQLRESLDCFDITALKYSLNEFGALLDKLREASS